MQDEGKQKIMSGDDWERFRKHWARVPGERFEATLGDREALIRILQDAYGISREDADMQLQAFMQENDEYFEKTGDSGGSELTPGSKRH